MCGHSLLSQSTTPVSLCLQCQNSTEFHLFKVSLVTKYKITFQFQFIYFHFIFHFCLIRELEYFFEEEFHIVRLSESLFRLRARAMFI